MSILDKASLIQIPSGYKSTKLYSLRPSNGDGDFTFARSSSATRVNSEGLIEVASVLADIYSSDFSSSLDGWTAFGLGNVEENISIGGENDSLRYTVTTAVGDTRAFLRLNSKTIGKKYKFTFSYYIPSTNANLNSIFSDENEIRHSTLDSWTTVTEYFTSAVTDIKLIVGDADKYLNPAATGETAYIKNVSLKEVFENDVPRLDYSGGATCASLLLEPQRTNLVTYSESFDNAAWTKSGTTITANNTTSPDGTTNADKIIASSGLSIKIAYQVISSTNSVAHTVSAFYKADEYSYAFLRIGGQTPSPYVIYNLLNQSVVSTANATSTKIEDYGSGWYRVSMTYTANSVTNAPNISFLPTSGYTLDSANQPSYNGDGSSGGYIYGAQLEQGSYPTSYIPSNSNSQTTRTADVCNNAGTSATFNDSEGVLFAEIAALYDDGTYRQISLTESSGGGDVLTLDYSSTSNQIRSFIRVNGAAQSLTHTLTDETQYNKIAIKYKDTHEIWVNGSKVASSSLTLLPIDINLLTFDNGAGGGDFYGKTKQLMVFDEALSDEELSDLTGQVNLSFNNLATFYGYTIL